MAHARLPRAVHRETGRVITFLPRKLLGTPGLLVAARVIAAGLALLLQVILARSIGAQGLGIYVIAVSSAAVLGIFATMGFETVTGRFVGEYKVRQRFDLLAGFRKSSLRHLFGASVVLCGGLIVAIHAMPGLFTADLSTALILGVIAAPIIGLTHINGAYANAHRHFLTGFLPNILLRPALHICLFIGLIWTFAANSVATALYAFILATILAALLQTRLIRQRGLLPDNRHPPTYETRLWRGAGVTMMVAAMLVNQISEIDVLLLSGLLRPDQIAVFNVCFRLVAFVGFGIYAVYQTTLPDLSEAYARSDQREIRLLINRANLICLGGAVIALIGFVVAGRPVLALFGDGFVAGYASLILFGCAQVIVAGVGPGAQMLMIAGRQNRCMTAYGIGLSCTIVLNFLLVPSIGLEGAVYALAIGMVTSSLLLWIFARRHLALDVSVCSSLRQFAGAAVSSTRTWLF
jgi:O-antigen/teichoic acid export membrane protein